MAFQFQTFGFRGGDGQVCLPVIYEFWEQIVRCDEGVGCHSQVMAGAAPFPVFRFGCQVGTDRILFDVAGSSKEVLFVQWEGGEAALPQIASPLFPEVDHSSVAAVGFANGTGETGFGFRNCDDMNVIGHEAVGPDGEVVFISLFFQDVQIRTLVSFFQKNVLSAISPLHDVVRDSGCNYPCDSCHVSTLRLFLPAVKVYLVLCPRNYSQGRCFLLTGAFFREQRGGL